MDLYNNPTTKFYTNFLYKAVFLSIFMLFLPLLSWQAPDHTTTWELLQLVFVGIAVSYGLFSKRNDETHCHKEDDQDHSQSSSYVARLLQASSSVFDGYDDGSQSQKHKNNTSKVVDQSWNSQYFRGEPPLVVVAKESDPVVGNLKNDLNRSSTQFQENVVLRSPIPWRSRSGRMEQVKQSPSSSNQFSSATESQQTNLGGRRNKSPVHTPPPPPPPPHNIRRINTYGKELRRNLTNEELQNRGRRTTTRSLSDGSKSLGTRNEYYLSPDNEIERFIETRRNNNKKKESMDDEEINSHTFVPEQKTEFTGNDSEDEEIQEELQELASRKNNGELIMDKGGPDVDKKADEFIAKFREQIRLQRIASIRTSTALTNKNLNHPHEASRPPSLPYHIQFLFEHKSYRNQGLLFFSSITNITPQGTSTLDCLTVKMKL